MGIDRPVKPVEVVSKHPVDDLLPGEDAAGLAHQHHQEAELRWGEGYAGLC